MRHLQRRAVSSGKRGSTRRSGPHNVPGQPIPGLEHLFPGTAFLTFTENFLCFDCARCPLRALLRRARTLHTPKAPPPSRAPRLLGEILMGKRTVGKGREGVCSPPRPSGGWAGARSDGTQDTLTQIFDHSNYPLLSCTKRYLHAGIKLLLCHPPSPHAPLLQAPHPTLSKDAFARTGAGFPSPSQWVESKGVFVCLALIKMTECQVKSGGKRKKTGQK